MPKKTTAIVRPKSLTDITIDNIRKSIIEGEFELGQAISENMLIDRYQISKTPIKLALIQLRAEGLVDIIPQKGSYVFTSTHNEVSQLTEWRVAMETTALEIAYAHNKIALIDTLHECFEEMKRSYERKNLSDTYTLDSKFHHVIVEYSNNKYLLSSYNANISKIKALLFRFGSIPWEHPDRFREHEQLIEALEADKVLTSKSILSIHLEHICEGAWLHSLEAASDQGEAHAVIRKARNA